MDGPKHSHSPDICNTYHNMKNNLRKSVLTSCLAMTVLCVSATTQVNKQKRSQMVVNPLLRPSTLPYGAPDFSKIKDTDYMPALKAGIEQQRQEINRIVNNKQKPTFANVILAYEKSGQLLNRVSNILFGLTNANKTPALGKAEEEAIALLNAWQNEISFNQPFFKLVKYVYDHEYNKLTGEDKKLLEEVYKGFVRAGALLPADKKARMEQINNRLANLEQQFGNLLPESTNAAAVWVSSKKELAGLSDADIAQCQKDAENLGGKAPYCIVIINTTQQPILASLDNRALREKVYNASVHRADGTNRFNTFALIAEIAKLRAEKAEIMGFKNYASYSLDDAMAKNTDNVYAFLKQLIAAYSPKAAEETKAIEAYARKTMGEDFKLQPYDRFYFSTKMKKEQFNFSDEEVKPYFNIDSVLVNGVFYAAHQVYGLTFRQRHDIPTYHPDMKVFDVIDKNGKPLALFYCDYFRRPAKRGGAWMDAFVKQSRMRQQLPIIYNVCNYAKAPDGQPTLLTWDEVSTMFHEFGHALHGMLSNCRYNMLSGTAVARDFVEMPSQFNEFFASVPEVFNHYAKHFKTGEPMPEALKAKMLGSLNFHSAYALGENLAATCADLAWHSLSSSQVPTADKAKDFESSALRQIGLLDDQIPPRYHTSYFNHVWGGGYAAGYYSYLWSEVLAANVADYFKAHGSLDPAVGQAFRDKVLSRGNTGDLMQMFGSFTGLKTPDAKALMKARGL